jgi:hypothetical protein
MKSVPNVLPAKSLAVGLALSLALGLAGQIASAQQPAAPGAPAASIMSGLKPATPACMASAREILQLKNVAGMYAYAIPNLVHQTKDQLLQSNLNYQKDLNEVEVIVAQKLAGREKEIGEGMAQIYCNAFSDQELKDLVTFYKSPLGQKLISAEPRAIQASMAYMNSWGQSFAATVNGEFRAEMRKRGKEI